MVPGLLQTAGYARAVTRASLDGLPDARLDSLVEVRLTRQRVLRASPPLRFTAVLDEAVLHREVGGPEVMRDQLEHLTQVSQLPPRANAVVPPAGWAGTSDSPALSSSSPFRTFLIWMW
ncbi:transcriptional regulator [Streptomyces badius]